MSYREPDKSARREGMVALDYSRFLSALFILVFHFGENAPIRLRDMSNLFKNGWLATDFFIILSGFVLMRAYGDRLTKGTIDIKTFMLTRVLRIWPAHMIVLLALLGILIISNLLGAPLTHAERFSFDRFIAQVFLVHGWGFYAHPGWNVPSWTLSALLVAYSLFILTAKSIGELGRFGLVLFIGLILLSGLLSARFISDEPFVDQSFRFGLLRVIPLFFIGVGLERFSHKWTPFMGQEERQNNKRFSHKWTPFMGQEERQNNKRFSHNWTPEWANVERLFRIFSDFNPNNIIYFLIIFASVIMIIVIGSLPRHLITDVSAIFLLSFVIAYSSKTRFKETPLSQSLGRSSYALFITHTFVGAAYFGIIERFLKIPNESTLAAQVVWLIGLGVAVVFAFLFERFINQPIARFIKNRLIAKIKGL